MGQGKQSTGERPKSGYNTKDDTNVSSSFTPMPHVIESMVELSGIEPLTSSLRKC